jgi:RNA ligase
MEEILSALVPGTTYLAEAVYPENLIVVRYASAALVLLSAYDEHGIELTFEELEATAAQLGWRAAQRHHFASLSDLVAHAAALPATAEGFVVRFENGRRLKMKGAEYRRIHALISRCTPIAMWEALAAGDDMQAIRRMLPEEFWGDFDAITGLLQAQKNALVRRIEEAAAAVAHKPDKELGTSLDEVAADVRPFIFSYRKAGNRLEGKTLANVWKAVRPTANVLPNYTPSYALIRVIDEAS